MFLFLIQIFAAQDMTLSVFCTGLILSDGLMIITVEGRRQFLVWGAQAQSRVIDWPGLK